MSIDKPLGEVVRGVPALLHLMSYLERYAGSIYVRDTIAGQVGNYALSDLPAPRAIHWVFDFLRRSTLPIGVYGQEEPFDPEEDGDDEQDDGEES